MLILIKQGDVTVYIYDYLLSLLFDLIYLPLFDFYGEIVKSNQQTSTLLPLVLFSSPLLYNRNPVTLSV